MKNVHNQDGTESMHSQRLHSKVKNVCLLIQVPKFCGTLIDISAATASPNSSRHIPKYKTLLRFNFSSFFRLLVYFFFVFVFVSGTVFNLTANVP